MKATQDLREWMALASQLGQLREVLEADAHLEIGAITEEVMHRRGPALLFDEIPGFPKGQRILTNCLGSLPLLALTLGLPPEGSVADLLGRWREKRNSMSYVLPEYVLDGPVMENVRTGKDINVLDFPAPMWHELDGGQYLGTGCVVITKDPDSGWVNLGCYRVMVHGEKHVSVYISPGKHGALHRENWLRRGQPMPVAVSFGHDPLFFAGAFTQVPPQECEYDFIGGVLGEPVEVIRGPVTGLPIPARAELVIEGFLMDEQRVEGPFGEWTGYYGSGARPERLVEVQAIYHRDDPINLGQPPVAPPSGFALPAAFLRSADIWDALERAGLVGIRGVWNHEVPGMIVVGMTQRYGGHATQVAMVAGQCQAGAYLNHLVVVVDDDIDVTDLGQVMWAVCTRSDPVTDTTIIQNCWTSALDSRLPPEKRAAGDLTNSRLVINATRPFAWRDRFPGVVGMSKELQAHIKEKWKAAIE